MPFEIQDPTPGSKLQKLFKLVGRVKPRLEESIMPVVLLDDLTLPADTDQLVGGNLSAGAGGAGIFSMIDLVNDPSSNSLVIVDAVIIDTATGAAGAAPGIQFQLKTYQGFTAAMFWGAQMYFRDARLGQASSACGLAAITSIAPVTGNAVANIRLTDPNSGGRLLPVKWILNPGTSFRVVNLAGNSGLDVSFLARVRPLS